MTTTTQPTTTRKGQTRASWIFEGIRLFNRRFSKPVPVVLTRAESIREIVKARRCHCHGTCSGCRHLIKDVLGD